MLMNEYIKWQCNGMYTAGESRNQCNEYAIASIQRKRHEMNATSMSQGMLKNFRRPFEIYGRSIRCQMMSRAGGLVSGFRRTMEFGSHSWATWTLLAVAAGFKEPVHFKKKNGHQTIMHWDNSASRFPGPRHLESLCNFFLVTKARPGGITIFFNLLIAITSPHNMIGPSSLIFEIVWSFWFGFDWCSFGKLLGYNGRQMDAKWKPRGRGMDGRSNVGWAGVMIERSWERNWISLPKRRSYEVCPRNGGRVSRTTGMLKQ